MQRQRALADASFPGAHGHEMTYTGEPVGDAGPLPGNLLEDSGPSVAGDIVVLLHRQPGDIAARPRLRRRSDVARLASLHRLAGALPSPIPQARSPGSRGRRLQPLRFTPSRAATLRGSIEGWKARAAGSCR